MAQTEVGNLSWLTSCEVCESSLGTVDYYDSKSLKLIHSFCRRHNQSMFRGGHLLVMEFASRGNLRTVVFPLQSEEDIEYAFDRLTYAYEKIQFTTTPAYCELRFFHPLVNSGELSIMLDNPKSLLRGAVGGLKKVALKMAERGELDVTREQSDLEVFL